MCCCKHPTFCLPWVQATSYLVTAWEALAAQQGKKPAELPVLFEDVSIVQAVPVAPGGSVTLCVLLDASRRFQVGPPRWSNTSLMAWRQHGPCLRLTCHFLSAHLSIYQACRQMELLLFSFIVHKTSACTTHRKQCR